MKRILFVVLAIVTISCTQSPQKKAEALIKETIQKTLALPNSYQPVETKLDSAFSPFHDPAFIALYIDLYEKAVQMELLKEEVNSAKSSMAIWSGPYSSSFGKEQYRQAKEEYNTAKENLDRMTERVEKKGAELRAMSEKEPEFIGCRVRHTYRADDNGKTVLLEKFFLLDKDITTIVAQWDKEEIDHYQNLLKLVSEVAE